MLKIRIDEETVNKLLDFVKGEATAHRWTRTTDDGKKDRIYIDNVFFGLEEWFTKSTGFHHAQLRNLSHNKSRKYIGCKNYIDLMTGDVVSMNKGNWYYNFQEELEELVEKILNGEEEEHEK